MNDYFIFFKQNDSTFCFFIGVMLEMNYSFRIERADMERVMTELKGMKKDMPKHLRNVLNRTVTQTMKQINAGRKNNYTISAAGFKKEIKAQRASVAHLDAVIRSSGRKRTLNSFKTSTPQTGAKADILKNGLKLIQRTEEGGLSFVAPGGKAAGLIVRRTERDRDSLEVLHSLSVPKMVEKIWSGDRGGQGNLQESVQERLHREIQAEIAKII